MMTPQEVSSHAFSKAALGGYNMAMVDEFLDLLTEDYTTLYNDNAILKNKLKILSDTVEEYRATDEAMRKTLLAAQQMAESMVRDAEAKKAALLHEAQTAAQKRIEELREKISAEEYRLKTAREATAAYVAKVSQLLDGQSRLLEDLDSLVPPGEDRLEETVEDAARDIESSLSQMLTPEGEDEEEGKPTQAEGEPTQDEGEPAPAREPVPAASKRKGEVIDLEATRRFEDLQFGKDYEIT